MGEEWKNIEGYNGDYQVSDLGNVKSFKRSPDGVIMKQFLRESGYKYVTLRNPENKNHRIHLLVAKHFIPNPENKNTVNHDDGNKTNNKKSNLSWMTNKENTEHAIKNGLINKNNTPHLTQDELNQIKNEYMTTNISQKALADKYNRSYRHMQRILSHLKRK